MEKIEKYKAKDGKEFHLALDCIDYENLIDRVDKIMSQLSPKPKIKGCDFENGGGFLQHDIKVFKKVRIELLNEFKNKIKHKWIQESIDDESVHPSYVGRLIDDSNISPYNSAWYRISCTDPFGREFGQIYYRNNPKEAKQKCLNTTS